MLSPSKEILTYIVLVSVVFVVLAAIIIAFLLLYQRKKYLHKKDIIQMKKIFKEEALKSAIEIQEQMKRDMARELHDNYGQILTAVHMSLSVLPLNKPDELASQVTDAKSLIKSMMIDIREFSARLGADMSLQAGLYESIQAEVERLKRLSLFQVDFRVKGEPYSPDKQVALILFRIFQELVTNVSRHSKAQSVSIELDFQDGYFTMEVRDNGKGFDMQNTGFRYGSGLKNIQYRCQLLGASCEFISKPRQGTSVTVSCPQNNKING